MKFLVCCTPNGSISFISSVYLGSVSDPALTYDCGFLPPFLESRGQLPAEDVQRGRSIASLRIHVERAIGRMKQYNILSSIFPLQMARIANQIVTVCDYLSNFHPALVPVPVSQPDSVSRQDNDEKADGSEQCSEERLR